MKPAMPWKPGLLRHAVFSPTVEDAHCQRDGVFQSPCQSHLYSHNSLPQITLPKPSYCQKSPSCYPRHMHMWWSMTSRHLWIQPIVANLEPQQESIECKVQRSRHKVQRSGPVSALVSTGCSNNRQLQPPPPPTMQIWPTQRDAAITATYVRANNSPYKPSPNPNCSDCCIVLYWSYLHGQWYVVVVVVASCCCIPYRLALMLARTFAPYIP